jgi:hypothetical protein
MFRRITLVLLMAAAAFAASAPTEAEAAGRRQYYGSWSYHPSNNYYYTRYHYRPTPTYPTYSYHYCIHYPSQPRYVYYYNPHARHYWGRFDTEGKEGAQYSLLKPEDRKENLEDIPETAFPKPGKMPGIPEGTDGTKSDGASIEPVKDLPDADATPDDTPAGIQKK